MKKRPSTAEENPRPRAKAASGQVGRGRRPAKAKGGGKAETAAKMASERQAEKDRRRLEAELRRLENRRLRDIDRRLAARERKAERKAKKRKKIRWEKMVARKARKAYLKWLKPIWGPKLKYRFIPRAGEAPEEVPIRKKAEKRAFREYKRYRLGMKRDKEAVKYERLEKQVTMFLRGRFPNWIMEDAVHEGITETWDVSGQTVKRRKVRRRAHRVWQALSDERRHRALIIDAARKRGVKLTKEEIDEQVVKFRSVQQLAIMVEVEHSSEMRWETPAETYERLLADSARGRTEETPLDELIAAEAVEVAFTDSGLNPQEAEVANCLHDGMSQKAVAGRLGLTKGYISTVAGKAAKKIADRLGLERESCYFGYKKRKKVDKTENDEHAEQ